MIDADRADTERLLLLKGRAGLGNRMLAAATALLYARLTRRSLVVDWTDGVYAPAGSNAFPELFEQPAFAPLDELPATGSVIPELWRGHLGGSVRDLERRYARRPAGDAAKRYRYRANAEFLRTSTVDLRRLDDQERVAVMWLFTSRVEHLRKLHQGALPAFPRGSSAEILRDLLAELVARRQVRDRVEAFRRDHFRAPMIGVHVRYSDRRSHLPTILKRLDALLEREPRASIFLATDNVEVKARFERRYASVVSSDHWFPSPGDRLHRNRACPDLVASGHDALVDLYLLAASDYLVCDTLSSFAQVASLLSGAPANRVVDVKRAGAAPVIRLARMRIASGVRGLSPRGR